MFRLLRGTLTQHLPQIRNRMVGAKLPALSTQSVQSLATKAARPGAVKIKQHNKFIERKSALIRELDLYVNQITVFRPLEAKEIIKEAGLMSIRFMLTKCQSNKTFKQCLIDTKLKALLKVPVEKIPQVKKAKSSKKLPSADETARLSTQLAKRSLWELNPEQQQFESNKKKWLQIVDQYIEAIKSTQADSAAILARMQITKVRQQFEACGTKAELVAAIAQNNELFYNNEWGIGVLSSKTVTESSIKEGLDIWFMKRLQGTFPADIVMGPELVRPRKP